MAAFIAGAPVLASSSFTGAAVCAQTASAPAVAPTALPAPFVITTMKCRRDLKREKALRNLEFARIHRKKVVRRFNRRAQTTEKNDKDNEYLSSVYGTIRFGEPEGGNDRREGGGRDGGGRDGGGRDGGRGGRGKDRS